MIAALAVAGAALTGCATTDPQAPPAPPPSPGTSVARQAPAVDPRAVAEEARALLAQAETDIQRARARRALWARAWEALVAARASQAQDDQAGTIRNARRASELSQLGLEQLAYPAVKYATPVAQRAGQR